jgi:hypothetical protein
VTSTPNAGGYTPQQNSANVGSKSRNPSSGSQYSSQNGPSHFTTSTAGTTTETSTKMLMANVPRSTTNKTATTYQGLQQPGNEGNNSGRGVGSGYLNTNSQLPPFMRSGGGNT